MPLPAPGTRVHVHKNLHLGLWSVTHAGKVVAHVERVALEGATCRVQPGGQAAVRRSGVRSVHAYVVGVLVDPAAATRAVAGLRPTARLRRFSYNPHRDDTFVDVASGEPVLGAEQMVFDEEGAWYL